MSLLLAAALAWTAVHPGRGFTFHGKPISPACVTAAVPVESGAKPPVVLAKCQTRAKPRVEDGTFTTDGPDGGPGPAYDSYKVLAAAGPHYAVEADWSGGGTGRFTNLVLLRRAGGTLVLEKTLAGGDRCNGGIEDSAVDGATLTWSQNITPYDLVDLGGVKTLAAYKDLEASASSCVAAVDHTYHLGTGREDAPAVSFTDTHLDDQPGWTGDYKYQHCFNAYYGAYAAKHGGDALSPADVKAFAAGFLKTCVKT
ncbi:MAG TPA: hypothetical protein VG387_00185 [Rhizomicrobium sp.]|jgi:hypothetical protein|nr:hypothetical protein [Rhizomicrobium sp.]